MGISIYKRIRKDGYHSLYLRINHNGVKRLENLNLKTGEGSKRDREAEKLANTIMKKRDYELASGKYSLEIIDSEPFLDFVDRFILSKKTIVARQKYQQALINL